MNGRLWARIGFAAQVIFIVSWLVAATWQGDHYSVVKHSISDMYAAGAPAAVFLLIVLTLAGIGTILFALLSVLPVLRAGGWAATTGAVLLALSIFGLGDLLTIFEREGCRLADAGCTSHEQLANAGGKLDSTLSTLGIFLFLAAFFFLARAMRRVPGWQRWAAPTRWAGVGFFVVLVIFVIGQANDMSGLFERLLAAYGALAIAALAMLIIKTPAASEAL